ncbi:MAG: hypothetical protein AB1439_10450 [candidate division FCPU426 bacterium]
MSLTPEISWLEKMNDVMDILWIQQRALAQNIANVNTPGFIRQTVDFAAELKEALGDPSRPPSEIEIQDDLKASARVDGNSVNLEREMVELAEVTQTYGSLARLTAKNLSMARIVITGGKG